MNYRENHICLICEKNNTLLPWTICRSCGEFIVLNWNKLNKEEYRVDGGRRMRRAKNRTVKMSITMPLSIFNELERTLSYTQSRSKFISTAVSEKLDGESTQSIPESSTRQLMAAITSRDDVDDTLKHLLLQILAK